MMRLTKSDLKQIKIEAQKQGYISSHAAERLIAKIHELDAVLRTLKAAIERKEQNK